MDDIRIIDMFWQRDEEVIRQTEMKYGRLLISVADNILRSREDARECLNDTYLGVLGGYTSSKASSAVSLLVPNRPQPCAYIHAAKRNPVVAVSFDELEAVLADKETEETVEEFNGGDEPSEIAVESTMSSGALPAHSSNIHLL